MDVLHHLRVLEARLQEKEVRGSETALSSLLAVGFEEFGSSGTVYSREELIASLAAEGEVRVTMEEFRAELLSPSVALVTYRAVVQRDGATGLDSLRSSVWVLGEEGWRIRFHQGTRMSSSLRQPATAMA